LYCYETDYINIHVYYLRRHGVILNLCNTRRLQDHRHVNISNSDTHICLFMYIYMYICTYSNVYQYKYP
jgi:hypothetical protein